MLSKIRMLRKDEILYLKFISFIAIIIPLLYLLYLNLSSIILKMSIGAILNSNVLINVDLITNFISMFVSFYIYNYLKNTTSKTSYLILLIITLVCLISFNKMMLALLVYYFYHFVGIKSIFNKLFDNKDKLIIHELIMPIFILLVSCLILFVKIRLNLLF